MLTLVSLIFVILGAINWFLVGAFEWDFIAAIFGSGAIVSRIAYAVIGLMALWLIFVMIFRRDILSYNKDFTLPKKTPQQKSNKKERWLR